MQNLSLEKKHFKDKCDKCGKFAILKGVDFLGQCLCENCISSYSPPPEEKTKEEKQLTLFDMEVLKNDVVRN